MKILLAALLALPLGASAGEIRAEVKDHAGKPVEDAVVFVYEVSGATFTAPAEPAVMDQIDTEFVPHVLPVLVGAKVRFPNKDKVHHQIYSFSKAKTFDLPLYRNVEPSPILMDKSGVVKLGCNIHDWMRGYILVLDNPYFGKTDQDGSAILSAVPPGKYRVAVWSERLKEPVEETLQGVEVAGDTVHIRFPPKLGPLRKSVRHPVVDY